MNTILTGLWGIHIGPSALCCLCLITELGENTKTGQLLRTINRPRDIKQVAWLRRFSYCRGNKNPPLGARFFALICLVVIRHPARNINSTHDFECSHFCY
ncbi:uncharacterized protein EI90DRAFT_2241513 [Cantharellus anzutake]|uniref:uncharacterized protein n=1 Tax=Cantharellus anzutake TaxID=1750568 RepID=UPI0019089E5E|nr:uncharacterized protein EI90DRAFT_2241513 [Cantharellus anzutake]KAF8324706.1 hypothetical protein EI90DRAFT_2241513 [Cantharellus anzutake]